MKQMSSTCRAVCGDSSESHAPERPCRSNLKTEDAVGKLDWYAVIPVSRSLRAATPTPRRPPRRRSDRRNGGESSTVLFRVVDPYLMLRNHFIQIQNQTRRHRIRRQFGLIQRRVGALLAYLQ